MLDWRRAYAQLRYELHALPKQVQTQLLKLTQLLGLQFSSLDLLLTPGGEYVYLEQNPNGQWYWLEERLGARLPLAEAMARLLAHSEEEAV
jgi:glutathione synthase/RimK-type ligase-like ATP-grasp enzyme